MTDEGARAAIEERSRRVEAEFAALDNGIARYRYLVARGEGLPPFDAAQRTDANRLPGCQYGVWILSDYDAERDAVYFRVDSDAKIVRGLAALIVGVLDGLPPAAIAGAELTFLDTTGLRAHLSSQRGDGLSAMLHELRRRARGYLS